MSCSFRSTTTLGHRLAPAVPPLDAKGTRLAAVQNAVLFVHHASVERVLHPRRGITRPEQALRIGLVIGKQELRSTSVYDIAREQIAPSVE
jgi:hypothetical protein